MFVDGKVVHVPNAGNIEQARKTRLRNDGAKNLALTRTDVDLNYNIEQYFVDPQVIPNLEKVQLTYNKRESTAG
jgi:hypothetical protein